MKVFSIKLFDFPASTVMQFVYNILYSYISFLVAILAAEKGPNGSSGPGSPRPTKPDAGVLKSKRVSFSVRDDDYIINLVLLSIEFDLEVFQLKCSISKFFPYFLLSYYFACLKAVYFFVLFIIKSLS